MNENRMQVLQMLSAGQINAEEAERLLAALENGPAGGDSGPVDSRPKARPKYLRVLVEARDDPSGAPTKVNVRVPMQLLRAGVKLASLIPVQARNQVNDALRGHGVQFDLSQLKPENLEELVDQLSDLTVDVDAPDKEAKVRVFCE
jgi:hypothetical protein